MRFPEIYSSAKPVISFEFFPPKTDKGEENLFAHVEELKKLKPGYFSMTYGAGGSTRDKTISLGERIRKTSGVETVCHVTCVGHSRAEVRGIIEEIKSRGMQNIMALRGDPPQGQPDWQPHPEGYHHAIDLVRAVREVDGLSAAVAGFPEVHPEAISREADLRFLKEKVEAGADAVVCQLFFDNREYYRFARDAKAIGIKVPIVPGIMPILSVPQVHRIANLCKSRIPDELEMRLRAVEHDEEATREAGIEWASRQIADLLESRVPGVHVYCLNRSEASLAIFRKVGIS
jgi:methylenetetrahydrofolate reductase (NADPH)